MKDFAVAQQYGGSSYKNTSSIGQASSSEQVTLIALLITIGLGAIELWAAIPAGLALGLHPVLAGAAAASGAMLGVFVVLFSGERIRLLLSRKRKSDSDAPKHAWVLRVWNRWGVVGLGLLAPLITGALLGTAIGMMMGARSNHLLLWMALGTFLWSAILTFAVSLGLVAVA